MLPRFLALTCALALSGTVAFAQTPPSDDAEALLRQGLELQRDGDTQAALDFFRQSIAITPTGRALAQAGLIEQSLGRWLDAEAHLTRALAMASDDRWVRHHRRSLEEALDESRRNITQIEITCSVEGAEIRIDDRVIGRAPLTGPLRLPIGRITVSAHAEGYEPIHRMVTLYAGQSAREELFMGRATLTRVEPPPPPRCAPGMVMRGGLCYPVEAPERRTGLSPWRVMFYSGVGLAVLSGVFAVALWADGDSTAQGYLDRCGGAAVPMACQSDWTATQDALSGRAAAVNTFWALTGVGAAVAAVGIGVDLSRPRSSARRTAGLSLTPTGVRWTW